MSIEYPSKIHAAARVIYPGTGVLATVAGSQGFDRVENTSLGVWEMELNQPIAPNERVVQVTPLQGLPAEGSIDFFFAQEYVSAEDSAEEQASVIRIATGNIAEGAPAPAIVGFQVVIFRLSEQGELETVSITT